MGMGSAILNPVCRTLSSLDLDYGGGMIYYIYDPDALHFVASSTKVLLKLKCVLFGPFELL